MDSDIIFCCERHAEMFGDPALRGSSMSLFITYWPRYRFCAASGAIEQIGFCRKGRIDGDVEESAAEREAQEIPFTLEQAEDGTYVLRGELSKQTAVVTCEQDVLKAVDEMCRGYDWTAGEDPEGYAEEYNVPVADVAAIAQQLGPASLKFLRKEALREWQARRKTP